MVFEELLERFDGVTGSGDQRTTPCPAHDDRHASLSIGKGQDGRVLIKCQAGCDTADVLAAKGLKMSDLFPDSPTRRNGNGNGQHRRKLRATYDYTDREGNLLHQKIRYYPKEFRQRRPNGKGGWLWGLKGVQTVLYRLPQVLEAIKAGRRIYLCEGEKDADRLVKLGLDATTWTEGASAGKSKWKPRYTEALRGARVVLVPDNDEPGRKSMRDIARALHGVAAEVRIIKWPA